MNGLGWSGKFIVFSKISTPNQQGSFLNFTSTFSLSGAKVSKQQTPTDPLQKGNKWRSSLKHWKYFLWCLVSASLSQFFFFNHFLTTRFTHQLASLFIPASALGTKVFHNNLVPPNGSKALVPQRQLMRCCELNHQEEDSQCIGIKPLVV